MARPHSDAKQWLLFPVETLSRELDFRVVLACLVAAPNRRILVGRSRLMLRLVPMLGGGLYVGKNVIVPRDPGDTSRLDILRSAGFRLLYLDEEGAVYPGDESTWRRELRARIDPNVLSTEDRLCAWGLWQADVHAEDAPQLAHRIHATGHPRFDLCKPRWRAYYRARIDALRAQYGKFVLINSNLARVNHAEGSSRAFAARSGYRPEDPEHRLEFVNVWRSWADTLSAMVELVHILSVRRPDLTYVVRPHPSEDATFYRHAFGGVSNVHVVRDESVIPWLGACHAMIHDGCTTAIEGSLAGTRVINYKAIKNRSGDRVLPNLFGRRASSPDEVLAALDSDPIAADSFDPVALSLLHNLNHDGFEALAGVIDAHAAELTSGARDVPRGALKAVAKAWDAEQGARGLGRVLSPRRRVSALHVRAKFDRIDYADLALRFQAAQAATGSSVACHQLGDALFEVTGSSQRPRAAAGRET